MRYDSFESATYNSFAVHARMDSDWELARVFQESADADRSEHFAREAQLEGVALKTPDNLRSAIDTEKRGGAMYAQFALEAVEDGDLGVSTAFEKISREKADRCERLEGLLAEMGLHGDVQTVGG